MGVTSTQEYAKMIEQRYCAKYNVDAFSSKEMWHEQPARIEEDVIWWFFNLRMERRKVRFYRWLFRWEKYGGIHEVVFDPILKKKVKEVGKLKKNIHWYIDENAMNRELKKLITDHNEKLKKEMDNGLHSSNN